MFCHCRCSFETPFKWRIAGGPTMARFHWYLDPLSPRQPKEVVKVGPPLTKLPDSAHVYFVCANI